VPDAVADILAQTVFVAGANLPFGKLSEDQVGARAQELRAATGWGPTARVAPVALAWAELAQAMQQNGADTVAALPAALIQRLAPRLWVVIPTVAG
jgi:hypothetical protein